MLNFRISALLLVACALVAQDRIPGSSVRRT
jgi:hypothetical protein